MARLERAENMMSIVKGKGAPADVEDMAYDAIQCFVAAQEARRAKNKAEAARQHRHGVKLFDQVKDWAESHNQASASAGA